MRLSRTPSRRIVLRGGLAFAALATATTAIRAQDYPARTVKIIVPYPAGGITDVLPRIRDRACEPVGNTPAQTRTFVQGEAERWKKVIQTAGIKLE